MLFALFSTTKEHGEAGVPLTCAVLSAFPMTAHTSANIPNFNIVKGCQFLIAGAKVTKEGLHTKVASQAGNQTRLSPAIATWAGDALRKLDTQTALPKRRRSLRCITASLRSVIKENRDKEATLCTTLYIKKPCVKASTVRAPIHTSRAGLLPEYAASAQSGWLKAEWFSFAFSNKECVKAHGVRALKGQHGRISGPGS